MSVMDSIGKLRKFLNDPFGSKAPIGDIGEIDNKNKEVLMGFQQLNMSLKQGATNEENIDAANQRNIARLKKEGNGL